MIDDILRPGEYVGVKEAAAIFKLEERTLRRWYRDDPRIGRRPLAGGRIELSLPAVLMSRAGRADLLDLYAQGKRDDPEVQLFIQASTV
ncbi:hypothetical protein [Devosia naphthalenivorans]|uniref:hypothetical protein n=1 Tax=Devosia naphthalenivorans TaxID=2082392 RepID=UPI000D3CC9E8|nr:hypothetical protein [Devosia naphthalenivorans]